ncbi:Translation initiation factor 5A [uncultured archaeon]|nr:Translation initiation factor 5A [uncultured archaeon]
MSDFEHSVMKELKIGKYVLIDGIPCKVVEIEVSAPGKHGAAKMRVTAIAIFEGTKKTILKPSDADVQVPIIDRKRGQIVSMTGDNAQVMDLATFETFEMRIPEEFKADAAQGKEVEFIETGGRKLINRIS